MKGDRVEAVVDTGQGVQTFDIVASKAGRRIEVVTTRGVVEDQHQPPSPAARLTLRIRP